MRKMTRDEFGEYVENHMDISHFRKIARASELADWRVSSVTLNDVLNDRTLPEFTNAGDRFHFSLADGQTVEVLLEDVKGMKWFYCETVKQDGPFYYWRPTSTLKYFDIQS